MPVEFLTDKQVAEYGRFARPPSRAELERFFLLNDRDRELVEQRRRSQKPMPARAWGFDSPSRHQPSRIQIHWISLSEGLERQARSSPLTAVLTAI
jgi:Domain of unknown function (DUF4158)